FATSCGTGGGGRWIAASAIAKRRSSLGLVLLSRRKNPCVLLSCGGAIAVWLPRYAAVIRKLSAITCRSFSSFAPKLTLSVWMRDAVAWSTISTSPVEGVHVTVPLSASL